MARTLKEFLYGPTASAQSVAAAPKVTGTREERLTRLATAIANGTAPNVFAIELTEAMLVRRKAAADAAEIATLAQGILEA